ncbi:MAG: hypothetical protein BGO70_09270 [Bacteroidetes bacterium 43-93]|nr:biliverdin-producing heme oxygenase [Bacteroidota bacterium]OJX00353.1 MAG: hypothetical protein BGO70_09270 [Bacteroidetes bacterium 43-93]
MFIEELRARTKEDHQQLDKLLIPYIKGCNTVAKYADLLQCFYGYFHPLESLISAYIDDDIVPQYSRRRKSNVIEEELQSMHENLHAINEDVPLPRIDNIAGALGAMYVLEGSTMGGKIISKILAENLGKQPSDIRFFNYYGDDTDVLWGQFVQSLNMFADELEDAGKGVVISVARNTFHCFKAWIEYYYLQKASGS